MYLLHPCKGGVANHARAVTRPCHEGGRARMTLKRGAGVKVRTIVSIRAVVEFGAPGRFIACSIAMTVDHARLPPLSSHP